MMSRHIHRILKFGLLMGDMVVCATGCFAFMRSFRMVAIEKNELDTAEPVRAAGDPRWPFAGIGAALFLLLFVVSEAAATIVVLRR